MVNLFMVLLACQAPSIGSVAGVTLVAEEAGDYGGWAAVGLGDVNGDGHDDILLGAFQANRLMPIEDDEDDETESTPIGSGVAYLLYGPIESGRTFADADAILMGDAASDTIGRSIAAACDYNGDGLGDIAIGGMHLDFVGHDSGGVFLMLDAPTGTHSISSVAFTIEGDEPTGHFGAALDCAGDVDGDGLDDLVVGAHLISDDKSTGRVTLISGAQLLEAYPDDVVSVADLAPTHWMAEEMGDYMGRAVSGVGDVNGDGFDDLAISAPLSRSVGPYGGAVYVVLGPADNAGAIESAAAVTWRGEERSSFGGWLSSAGDVNDDGYADVMIGAYKTSDSGQDVGSVIIMAGADELPTSRADALSVLVGTDVEGRFGFRFDGVGDIDSDGFDDLVIGAPTSLSSAGRAFLFYGSEVGATEASVEWVGSAEDDNFGFPAWAGDVDGDGVLDLLISAPGANEATGSTYLLSGALL